MQAGTTFGAGVPGVAPHEESPAEIAAPELYTERPDPESGLKTVSPKDRSRETRFTFNLSCVVFGKGVKHVITCFLLQTCFWHGCPCLLQVC